MPDRGPCHPPPGAHRRAPSGVRATPACVCPQTPRLHPPRPVRPCGLGETPPRRGAARPPHPLTPPAAGGTAPRPGHAETDTPGSPPPAPSTRTTPGRGADRPPGGHHAGLRQRTPRRRHQTVRRWHGHAQTAPARPQPCPTPERPCGATTRCSRPGATRSTRPRRRAHGPGAPRHRTARTGHGARACEAAAPPTPALLAQTLGGGTHPRTRLCHDGL